VQTLRRLSAHYSSLSMTLLAPLTISNSTTSTAAMHERCHAYDVQLPVDSAMAAVAPKMTRAYSAWPPSYPPVSAEYPAGGALESIVRVMPLTAYAAAAATATATASSTCAVCSWVDMGALQQPAETHRECRMCCGRTASPACPRCWSRRRPRTAPSCSTYAFTVRSS
jgi:hypothetical protein